MAGRYDKFSKSAQGVILLAEQQAKRFKQPEIGTEHLLLGLICRSRMDASDPLNLVFARLQADIVKVHCALEFILTPGEEEVTTTRLSQRATKVIELAVDEARRLGHHYIVPEHLLLGLIREGEGIAAGVLESCGVSLDSTRREIIKLFEEGRGTTEATKPPTVTLTSTESSNADVLRHLASLGQPVAIVFNVSPENMVALADLLDKANATK